MPKRDFERRSFKSDKAAKARYLLGVGSLEQAQLLAEQALAEDEDEADSRCFRWHIRPYVASVSRQPSSARSAAANRFSASSPGGNRWP